MYTQILVATDGTEIATKAVRQAGELAKAFGARLTIVTVTEQAPTFAAPELGWSVPASVYDDIREGNVVASRKLLEAALAEAGVPAETVHVENQLPYEGILGTASRIGADLIVMGSHGHRGLQRLLLGSQASKVLSLAEVPVLVVKG